MTRRKLFACLAPLAPMEAQTRTDPLTNWTGGTMARNPSQVLLLTPSGPRGATLGAGFSLDTTASIWQLSVAPGGSVAMRDIAVTMPATGVVTVPGLVSLFRNGIKLTPGVDYKVEADVVTLTAQGRDDADVWSATVRA